MTNMGSNEATLQSAVQHKSAASKQGLMQKMFARWFDAFVYNQIWEDPRVDLQALKLESDSRILTISSGGCNALNYLIEAPQNVTAVDLNRHHIFLTRLKIAAIEHLPCYEDFFKFFGYGKHPENVAKYLKYIAPKLDPQTRRFWEDNGFFGRLLNGKRINYFVKGGLYNHSRNGYFLRFFHRFAKIIGSDTAELISLTSPGAQEEFFKTKVSPFFDNFVIRTIGKLSITMFGLGIPPQQYEELKKDLTEGGSVIDVYRERAHRLAAGFDITDNYFAWQAFARQYDTKDRVAIPEYLKEVNFNVLRANISRMTAKIGSVTDEIRNNASGTFDRFVFLDAQDWMTPEILTDLWSLIAEKGGEDSRVIFRTAGAKSPLAASLPKDLLAKFRYEDELSKELFKQDRAAIYGGFHLYIRK